MRRTSGPALARSGVFEVNRAAQRRASESGSYPVESLAKSLAACVLRFFEAELSRRIARDQSGARYSTQPHSFALARLDLYLGQEVDRRARNAAAIAGGGRKGRAPGDLTKVIVLDDEHHDLRAQLALAKSRGDAIGLMQQDAGQLDAIVEIVFEGLLMTY
jgi:hypothetical protein